MASIPVVLPKAVTGEVLERACVRAANEIGYRAESIDDFEVGFSLGSVQRHRVYQGTHISLRNRFYIPVLEVRGIVRGQEQDSFTVWNSPTGLWSGYASERIVQNYLSAVSKRL